MKQMDPRLWRWLQKTEILYPVKKPKNWRALSRAIKQAVSGTPSKRTKKSATAQERRREKRDEMSVAIEQLEMIKPTGPTMKRGKSVQVVGTPWEFIRAVEAKFGTLEWDLAATSDNAKAPCFITPEQDTFTQNWAKLLDGGLGWLNPEFDPMSLWVSKCALEQKRGAEFLVLTPASVGANWFWDHVKPFATSYSVGRMKFEGHKDVYPKDLLLNHYCASPNPELQRWRWK